MKRTAIAIVLILSFSIFVHISSGAQNTFPSSGNVGIGTTSPGAKLSFPDLNGHSNPDGITWYNPSPTDYGIYRTAGAWTSPNYQQLRLNFASGIILDPGATYGKSYVDVRGGGLRVTAANSGFNYRAVLDFSAAGGVGKMASIEAVDQGSYNGELAFSTDNDNTDNFNLQERMRISKDGNVGIGISTPSAKLFVVNGSTWFKLLQESTGVGDMMVMSNQSGRMFSVNAFGTLQGKLTTQIGVNYLVNSANGTSQYAGLGSKKAPMIQLDAELGSINLYGENGSGADYRTAVLNLGVSVTANGKVGIGTGSPDEALTVNGKVHATEVKVTSTVPAPDYVFEKDYTLPSLEEIKTYIDQNKHLPEVPSAKEMEANGIQLGEMNMLLLKKIEEMTLHLIDTNKKLEDAYRRIEKLENKSN